MLVSMSWLITVSKQIISKVLIELFFNLYFGFRINIVYILYGKYLILGRKITI